MQLTNIQAFLAVVQSGSMSKAAAELFVTQPTLSHRILTLEKELGVQLLSRSKGMRSVPTDAGRAFVRIAEQWVSLMDSTRNLSTPSIRSTFRIAATQTLSNYVMPTVYAKMVQRNLPIDLELFTLHYQECYNAVERKTMDAVFVSRTISSDRVSAIPVYSEKMVLLCNADAPYCDGISPASLPADKGIYMHWNHNYAMWHEYWFGTTHHNVSADNMRLVEKMISVTDKWAIVPVSAAREVLRSERVKCLNLLNPPPNREIFLLTLEPQHEYTPLLIEDLISALNQERLTPKSIVIRK